MNEVLPVSCGRTFNSALYCFPNHWNTGALLFHEALKYWVGVWQCHLTSWGEGASLTLVDHPSSDDFMMKYLMGQMIYYIDQPCIPSLFLLNWLKLNITWCDCSRIQTHNHFVRKQTLKHLAKLAKWSSCVVSTIYTVQLTVCYYHVMYGFQSEFTIYSCSHLNFKLVSAIFLKLIIHLI